MNCRKKKGYRFFLNLRRGCVLLSLISIIPFYSASHPSLLGYKTLIPYSPLSSIFFIIIAVIFHIIKNRLFFTRVTEIKSFSKLNYNK